MKKYIILVLCIFLLSGCTNKYQKNYDLGIKYLEEGDYENAIIYLEIALSIEENIEVYSRLADAYYSNGDYEHVQTIIDTIKQKYGIEYVPNDMEKPYITASISIKGSLVDYYFYPDIANKDAIKNIRVLISNDKNKIYRNGLNAIEVLSKIVPGISMYDETVDNKVTVHIFANRNKVNIKLFEVLNSLNIVGDDVIEQIRNMLKLNGDDLFEYLSKSGYTCVKDE